MPSISWFLDDQPSQRFPVYCRGNVGEIVPNVATPLSASLTTDIFRKAFSALFGDTGAFSRSELDEPAATGGLFGGYLYFNLSFARSFAARTPGLRVKDVDRQMFGTAEGVPPFRRGPGDRNPLTKARAAAGTVRGVIRRDAPDLDAQRRETERWLASLPRKPDNDQVLAVLTAAPDRFAVHLRSLLEASLGAGLPISLLERLAKKAEAEEPGLLVRAMSGLGTIETARPAMDLWRLGRTVAASAELTAAFDEGVPQVLDRLRAARSRDATSFLRAFDAFLATHGHRGPNEVELASDTWATAPDTALAAIDRLRLSPAAADPVLAAERLARERDDARARLRARVAPPLRPIVDRLLDAAARGAANREQAKGTLVLGLSGLRAALFQVADRMVTSGQLIDRFQFFMVTVDEAPQLLREPESFTDELADRRAAFHYLNARVPPYSFDGRIPDPATWPVRSQRDRGRSPKTSFTGIGVSSGVATGPARIVIDPADPRGISPGDILVAPLTDPAWTPLFLAAAAVVVDVGALQSHAAIVARELGIPAVVSVDGASTMIRDGDLVEVDGDRGTVRVIGS